MRVVCAWCEAEGKSEFIREKEPFDDPAETHGICSEHKVKLGDPSNDGPVSSVAGA